MTYVVMSQRGFNRPRLTGRYETMEQAEEQIAAEAAHWEADGYDVLGSSQEGVEIVARNGATLGLRLWVEEV